MRKKQELPIPLEPCSERFADMSPAGSGKRWCSVCEKNVHDLSALSAGEAASRLKESGEICVRYVYEKGGGVVHRPSRAKRAIALTVLATAPYLLEACGGARPPDYRPATVDETSESAGGIVEEEASDHRRK